MPLLLLIPVNYVNINCDAHNIDMSSEE